MRTLEQRVKFDHGLTTGQHLVRFTLGERSRLALVRIGARGRVSYLAQPAPEDMYSCWKTVKGDACKSDGAVMVWAARSESELMAQFSGAPVADIPAQS